MGSNKYKGIRKTDGPKAKGKKQARKGVRQQGKKKILEESDPRNSLVWIRDYYEVDIY